MKHPADDDIGFVVAEGAGTVKMGAARHAAGGVVEEARQGPVATAAGAGGDARSSEAGAAPPPPPAAKISPPQVAADLRPDEGGTASAATGSRRPTLFASDALRPAPRRVALPADKRGADGPPAAVVKRPRPAPAVVDPPVTVRAARVPAAGVELEYEDTEDALVVTADAESIAEVWSQGTEDDIIPFE